MKDQTLNQFLERGTQRQLALALEVTEGAIFQMVSSGRDIRFKIRRGKIVHAYEVKPVGRFRAAA